QRCQPSTCCCIWSHRCVVFPLTTYQPKKAAVRRAVFEKGTIHIALTDSFGGNLTLVLLSLHQRSLPVGGRKWASYRGPPPEKWRNLHRAKNLWRKQRGLFPVRIGLLKHQRRTKPSNRLL